MHYYFIVLIIVFKFVELFKTSVLVRVILKNQGYH